MILYTAQYRVHDVDRLDITRSGCARALQAGKPAPGLPWAPSAELLFPTVEAMKAAEDDAVREAIWTRYAAAYREEMKQSYRRHRAAWDELLARGRTVLVCFCQDPARCHRTLAAGFLQKCGADFRGELRPEDVIPPAADVERPPEVLFGREGGCTPFITTDGRASGIVCRGRQRRRLCKTCGHPAPLLCDFPLKKKRCNAPICDRCAREVGPNQHHCPRHQEQPAPVTGPMPGKGATPQEVLAFRPLKPPGRAA